MSRPTPDRGDDGLWIRVGIVILLQLIITSFCLPPVTMSHADTLLWTACRLALTAYWIPTFWILVSRRRRLSGLDVKFITYGYPLLLPVSLGLLTILQKF